MNNYPTNTFTKIIIATDSEFKNVVFFDVINSPINIAEIKSLQYNTTYYWKAKTVNGFYGEESDWSDVCSFTTKGPDITIYHATEWIYYSSFKNEAEEDYINGRMCQKTGNTLEEYAARRGYKYGADLPRY